jgi:tetratricopeptide (TPR) repeat protein
VTARAFAILALSLLAGSRAAGDDAALGVRLRALIAKEDYRSALEVANAAIEENAESFTAWQFRAYALHQLGEQDWAGRAYIRTLDLDPENWWAAMNLAALRAEQGRWDQAVKAGELAARLQPTSTTVQAGLSRIHRERGEYADAVASVLKALEAGVDPVWAHAELGYLHWVLQDLVKSKAHWEKAKENGADEAVCSHGLDLVDWDRPRGSKSDREEAARRRRGLGPPWTFTLSGIEVRTRVGPRLPREVESLIKKLVTSYSELLGIEALPENAVRLHLSRTVEEHEAHRDREFPDGYSEKAFTIQRRGGPWGGRGRRDPRGGAGSRWIEVYVAWSAPGLVRSLSHELTHVVLRTRAPGARNMPVWLDEGLATYLELSPDERGRPASRTVRRDLLADLAKARAEGRSLSFRAMLDAQLDAWRGPDARARYAQAWSMVHFLVEGEGRGGARRLRSFLDAVDSGGMTPASGIIVRIYEQSVERLERAWAEHVAQLEE